MKNTTRNLTITVILIGLVLMAVEISAIAVFGSHLVGDIELPAFALARMISTARILDRLEALVVVVWVLPPLLKSQPSYTAPPAPQQIPWDSRSTVSFCSP